MEKRIIGSYSQDDGSSEWNSASGFEFKPDKSFSYYGCGRERLYSTGTWEVKGHKLILQSDYKEEIDSNLKIQNKIKVRVIDFDGKPIPFAGCMVYADSLENMNEKIHLELDGNQYIIKNTDINGTCIFDKCSVKKIKISNFGYPGTTYEPLSLVTNSWVIRIGFKQMKNDVFKIKYKQICQNENYCYYRSWEKARSLAIERYK